MKVQSYHDLMLKSLTITALLFVSGTILLGILGFDAGVVVYISLLIFLPTVVLTFFYLILDVAVFTGLFPSLFKRFVFSFFTAIVVFFIIVLIDMWISYPIKFIDSFKQMYFFLLMALHSIIIHFLLERFWYKTNV